MSRQSGQRVCSESEEWASGHITTIRILSEVVDGKLKNTATCQEGYSGTTCPGMEADKGAHWILNPKSKDLDIPATFKPWKFDPDIPIVYPDKGWMGECNKAKIYPPADQPQSEQ